MKKYLIFLLGIFSYTCAYSPYFSDRFCNEIDYWNSRPIKYKGIELDPDWFAMFSSRYSFTLIIRF